MFIDPIKKIRQLKQTSEVWEGTTRLARMWIMPKKTDPYRPYHLMFVSDTDRVVFTSIKDASPTPKQVCNALFKAMRRPGLGAGSKRRPRIVALDDKELVQAISPRLAEIGVLCVLFTIGIEFCAEGK